MGFTHKPTGTFFENRKNAIIIMGHKRYCQSLKKKEFDFSDKK